MDQTAEAARWLYEEKGLTPAEIASRLNITNPAAYNALRRAGAKLGTKRFSQAGAEGRTKAFAVVPTPVERDPCTYCGVRADVGCKHNRRAA